MPIDAFLLEFKKHLEQGAFVKATLSKAVATGNDQAVNIYLKPVELKGNRGVAATFRFPTRDEAQNYSPEQFQKQLPVWLRDSFKEAVFFFTTEEITLKSNRKGEYAVLRRKTPGGQAKVPQELTHDREKHRYLDTHAPWLQTLGITTAAGLVRADAQDKWRQINKYLEVIANLLEHTPLPKGARIVDMGSGKGYLTFALADYLQKQGKEPVEVLGIELRPQLVAFCNETAKAAGLNHLHFQARDIAEVQKERIDMLIALHACDTATDLALFAGIKSKATIILVAPCCHKQVRKDLSGTEAVQGITMHGILLERQAEIVTDSIRSLCLESMGYKTKVFEFIGVEHTPKNVMITAERRSPKPEKVQQARAAIAQLKAAFGLKRHFLEDLMQESE
jgi:SAM-dependent methyltransferase